jgi:hypothetical protein
MKKLVSIFLASSLLMCATVANAMDVSSVNVGDSVFVKKLMIDDEKCEVIEVNQTDGEVLVRKLNGTTEWVSADDLTGELGTVVRTEIKKKVKDVAVDTVVDIGKSIFSSSDSDAK